MNSQQRTSKRTSFPELLEGSTYLQKKQLKANELFKTCVQIDINCICNMLALLFVSAVWELYKVVQPILQDLPGNPTPPKRDAFGMESADTLPETNIFAPENQWLEYCPGRPIFRCKLLVSGSVHFLGSPNLVELSGLHAVHKLLHIDGLQTLGHGKT